MSIVVTVIKAAVAITCPLGIGYGLWLMYPPLLYLGIGAFAGVLTYGYRVQEKTEETTK